MNDLTALLSLRARVRAGKLARRDARMAMITAG
jgi:hypothetical protein